MPPSVPIRINILNATIAQEVWDAEAPAHIKKLYYRDENAPPNNDDLLVNGKHQRILNLALFCCLLFFADTIHDIKDNAKINKKYHTLHDDNKYLDYLWQLLVNIHITGVCGNGYASLFPTKHEDSVCTVPNRSAGIVLYCFIARLERI